MTNAIATTQKHDWDQKADRWVCAKCGMQRFRDTSLGAPFYVYQRGRQSWRGGEEPVCVGVWKTNAVKVQNQELLDAIVAIAVYKRLADDFETRLKNCLATINYPFDENWNDRQIVQHLPDDLLKKIGLSITKTLYQEYEASVIEARTIEVNSEVITVANNLIEARQI